MVGGQRIQVGLAHARKTAVVTVEADTYQITIEPGIAITAPRTTSRDIRRHKPPTTTDSGRTARQSDSFQNEEQEAWDPLPVRDV